jgi:hypothetical protein
MDMLNVTDDALNPLPLERTRPRAKPSTRS